MHEGLECECLRVELITAIGSQVRKAADARYGSGAGARLSGGLRNVRGKWLEYALGLIFWNTATQASDHSTAIIRLPSAAQLRFHELYEPRAKAYLEELLASLGEHEIEMTMSNPDFICVTNLPDDIADNFRTPMQMSEASVRVMNNAYQILQAWRVKPVISQKLGWPPDRLRLQIPSFWASVWWAAF